MNGADTMQEVVEINNAKPESAAGTDGNWVPEFEIGDRIRKTRVSKGLQQDEFAEGIGVARAMVGRWEVNAVIPSVDSIRRISDVYGVSLEWLIRGSSDGSAKIACKSIRESPVLFPSFRHNKFRKVFSANTAAPDELACNYGKAA